MTHIHMDIEVVDETARLLSWACEELYDLPSRLRSLAWALSSNWQGGRSGYYAGEIHRIGEILQQEVMNLQRLAVRVRNELNEWEQVDRNGAAAWRNMQIVPIIPGTSQAKQSPSREPFNWWKLGVDIGKGILTVGTGTIEAMQQLKYSNYAGIGRFLNKLVGNQKAGWVGRMEELGHLVKKNSFFDSPVFRYSGESLSLVFGVAEDLSEGDSMFKAVGSEVLELGIAKGVPYLIPGAGQAMLVYDGVLLVGKVATGTLALAGYNQQAVDLQNTLDALDLETYTEKLTDGILDMVENRRL